MKTFAYSGVILATLCLASCGGGGEKKEARAVDDDAFYATQPVRSGIYRAVDFNIAGGKEERKGHFDGRVMMALSPEQSGMYIYENGNRVKLDYSIMLSAPFAKTDSVYSTTDAKGRPVTISTDSTVYVLAFEKGKETIRIGFESKPMSTTSASDMWTKISDRLSKK